MNNNMNVNANNTSNPVVVVEFSKGKNVKYIVNHKTKQVEAHLYVEACEPQDLFDKVLFSCLSQQKFTPIEDVDYMDSRSFTHPEYIGVAKCHPGDEFDVEFGKKLALARAKKKHNFALINRFTDLVNVVADLAERNLEMADKLYRRWIDSGAEEQGLLIERALGGK